MGLFKCKCCGADLKVNEGSKIVTCEYCSSTQTIPNTNDVNVLSVYARGNNLRNEGEFDKAYLTLSKLLDGGHEDSELYWNLLLCKYGITYVDDYDGKKKPTINRVSMTSILEDDDYKKTLELADVISKENYEEEAGKIEKIQKDIIKIVHKEEPYDIFISYKETDEFGNRTEDSVLAQDIYEKLTDKGYRVFLSRITLSSVLGHEYEPYIYSALYTSKVLILVTCNIDYVNAVWVKNEWKRYYLMMQKDKNKTLVPCYRGIDPYDLPKEIRNLQAQDASRLGFLQDLVMGVDKLTGKSKNVASDENDLSNAYAAAFIKRAKVLGGAQKYDEAIDKIDKVLEVEPENEEANSLKIDYLLKSVKLYSNNNNFGEVWKRLELLRESYPDNEEIIPAISDIMYMGAGYLAKNGDIDGAIKMVNEMLDIDTKNGNAYYLRFAIEFGEFNQNFNMLSFIEKGLSADAFKDNEYYLNTIKFGDDALREKIEKLIDDRYKSIVPYLKQSVESSKLDRTLLMTVLEGYASTSEIDELLLGSKYKNGITIYGNSPFVKIQIELKLDEAIVTKGNESYSIDFSTTTYIYINTCNDLFFVRYEHGIYRVTNRFHFHSYYMNPERTINVNMMNLIRDYARYCSICKLSGFNGLVNDLIASSFNNNPNVIDVEKIKSAIKAFEIDEIAKINPSTKKSLFQKWRSGKKK